MNFPLEQPIFHFFYWLVNTTGVGGVIIGLVVGTAVVLIITSLRWIWAARNIGTEFFMTPPKE